MKKEQTYEAFSLDNTKLNVYSDMNANLQTNIDFINCMDDNKKDCEQIKIRIDEDKRQLIEKEKQPKSSNIRQLKDKVIVFTGGKDKDLIKLFEENNVKIGSGVSKNTFAVICKSKDEDSSKMTKAKELGISLLTLEEFKCKYV